MSRSAFEVEMPPVTETNQFETRFLVGDLESGKIAFAPRTQAEAGQLPRS